LFLTSMTEPVAKKQRSCKDALYTDHKHHLNQSHTFTIGKAPHSIQCHGFLFSLYSLSPLIHRFEEKKHWWKETVLLPEVSFDSPMAHETFRFLWNSLHGNFYRFLPKLTEGELKEGQKYDDWKLQLDKVLLLKEMVEYFEIKPKTSLWYRELRTVLRTCPVLLLTAEQLNCINAKIQAIIEMAKTDDLNVKVGSIPINIVRDLSHLLKRVNNQCSETGCTNIVCEKSRQETVKYFKRFVCDFHFRPTRYINLSTKFHWRYYVDKASDDCWGVVFEKTTCKLIATVEKQVAETKTILKFKRITEAQRSLLPESYKSYSIDDVIDTARIIDVLLETFKTMIPVEFDKDGFLFTALKQGRGHF
jgi:hypothetical protein